MRISWPGFRKERGRFERGFHQAAGIVAQIEHQAFQIAPPSFSMASLISFAGLLIEAGNAHIADAGLQHERAVHAGRIDQLRESA